MKIEDQIKRTVEEQLANRPSHAGAWEQVQRRFRSQRRIRMTAAIAGAAAAIVSVAVVVPNLGDDRKIVPIETPTTGPSETPASSPTPVAGMPEFVVVQDLGEDAPNTDDRIVVISTATGEIVRVLAEKGPDYTDETLPYSPFLGGMSLSPDDRTVYFTRLGNDGLCGARVMSVPIAGGEELEIANGFSPSVSPDGRFLVYQGRDEKSKCQRPPVIVRDLRTGEERRWEWAAENPEEPYLSGGPSAFAWSPDYRFIAFQRNVGDPLVEVWVLDTTKGETFLDAKKISPDETTGPGPKTSWESPAYLNGSTLLVAKETRSIHDEGGPLHVLVTFDLRDPDSDPVEMFDPKAAALDISVDRGTGAVLYATGEGVFRLEDGKAERIASGRYVHAAW